MKVLLQDSQSKLFYAGPRNWVKEKPEAFDFERIDLAAQAYETEDFPFAEILAEDDRDTQPLAEIETGPGVFFVQLRE